jgi:hypothetical protein
MFLISSMSHVTVSQTSCQPTQEPCMMKLNLDVEAVPMTASISVPQYPLLNIRSLIVIPSPYPQTIHMEIET